LLTHDSDVDNENRKLASNKIHAKSKSLEHKNENEKLHKFLKEPSLDLWIVLYSFNLRALSA